MNKEPAPDISGKDRNPQNDHYLEAERVNTRLNLVRTMIQASMQETRYQADIEWGVYHMARELEDYNHLPPGITANDVMEEYYRVFEGE